MQAEWIRSEGPSSRGSQLRYLKMNQVALSTVILRLIGFYLAFNLISGIAMMSIIQLGLYIPLDEEGMRFSYFFWIGVGVLTRLGFAVALILFAGRISRWLFDEERNVITAGSINGDAILGVGLCLLGVYFLIAHLPALAELSINWFRFKVVDASSVEFSHLPRKVVIEPLVMTILSLLLIFRCRTLSTWLSRVSK